MLLQSGKRGTECAWSIRRVLLPLLVCMLAMVAGQSYAQNISSGDVARWRKAAEQGHAQAQYELGAYYFDMAVELEFEGYVVPLDDSGRAEIKRHYKLATEWWRKAAEQGHVDASYGLGLCYHNGNGVRRDLAEAERWYSKAAAQGHAKAKDMLKILPKNTPSTSTVPAQTTGSSVGNASSYKSYDKTYEAFFPVCGVLPGKTTVSDIKTWGYYIDKSYSKSYNTNINSIAFWDHDGDQIFKDIYMTNTTGGMPAKWEKLGFDWKQSYDEWVALFKKMGFTIRHVKKPITVEFSGRKTLRAQFIATAPDQTFSMDLEFNYGNDHGEGYSTQSMRSLYSISVKLLQCPSTFPPSKPWNVSVASVPAIKRDFSDFFPVYNITLGRTTIPIAKSLGYPVEENKYASVNALAFWDHDKDGIFEDIYLLKSAMMPEKWVQLGLNWRLPYNDWLTLFQRMGFTIEHSRSPKVRNRAFSAGFTATAPDQSFEMELDFNYGDGRSANSKGTLYSITVREINRH